MHHRRRFGTYSVAAGLVVFAVIASASAALADDEPGIGITVIVTSAPVETPTPTPVQQSGGGGGGGAANPVEEPATSEPTDEPVATDGASVISVSGLTSAGHWTLNPLATEAQLSITVHNGTASELKSTTARFWVTTPTGTQLGESRTLKVLGLKAGETRTLTKTIHHLGQWPLLVSHVTVTPPQKVDGVSVKPVTREQFFIVVPWLVLMLAIVGVAALLIVRVLRFGSRMLPVGEPA